jgi:hypothetical protein
LYISVQYASARRNNAAVSAGRANDNSVAQTPIASAHNSIRATARRRSPRRSAATMNGKLAAVLRIGTRIGTFTIHANA